MINTYNMHWFIVISALAALVYNGNMYLYTVMSELVNSYKMYW